MEHSSSAAPHTGTTIVAVAYDGGVVLGADTRVTTGTYISNRTSDKIAELADHVFLCRSGSAADTQAVSDIGTAAAVASRPLLAALALPCLTALRHARPHAVRHFVNQHTMEVGGPLDVRTVATLAMQVRG